MLGIIYGALGGIAVVAVVVIGFALIVNRRKGRNSED